MVAFTSTSGSAATYTVPAATYAARLLADYPAVKAWWTLTEPNQRRDPSGARYFSPRLNNSGYPVATATNDLISYETILGHRLPVFTNLPPASIGHFRVPLAPLSNIWSFISVVRGDVTGTEPWGILFKADATSFLYAGPFRSNGFGISFQDTGQGYSNTPQVTPSTAQTLGQLYLCMVEINFATGAVAMSMDGGRTYGTSTLTNLPSKSQDGTWQLTIGRGRQGSGNGFDGVISEMMLVQGAMTTKADLSAVLREYALNTYAIA
jgi:hypothetical protein